MQIYYIEEVLDLFLRFSKTGLKRWEIDTVQERPETEEKYMLWSKNRNYGMQCMLKRIDFNHHRNYIIFGIQDTKLIEEIYKRMSPYSIMIVIEFTEGKDVYTEYNANIQAIMMDQRTHFILGNMKEIKEEIIKFTKDLSFNYNLKNITLLTLPYIKARFNMQINELTRFLFNNLAICAVAFGNSSEDILIGIHNFITNMPNYIKGFNVKYFKERLKDKPVVIVGAGPSLDKNMHILEEYKDKVHILTVDAALNSIRKAGIEPDGVASIERIPSVSKFYTQEREEELVYVGANVIVKDVLDRFEKKIFTGRLGDGFFRQINEDLKNENLNLGLNVANLILAFVEYLGFTKIIFVGLDLAYTDGHTHSKDIEDNFKKNFSDIYGNYHKHLRTVMGQNGEILETNENFLNAKTLIENKIALLNDIEFMNCTEGGAIIHGADAMKLEEALKKHCKDVVQKEKLTDIYDVVSAEYMSSDYMQGILEIVLAFMDKNKKYLEKLIEVSNECYDLLIAKKEKRIDLMIENRIKIDTLLIENSVIRFILQPIYIAHYREVHSYPILMNKEYEELFYYESLNYYTNLKDMANLIRERFDNYIDGLEALLEAI